MFYFYSVDMGPGSCGAPSPPTSPETPAQPLVPENVPEPNVPDNLIPTTSTHNDILDMNPPSDINPPSEAATDILSSVPDIPPAPALPALDQTTLINNEEESFALAPLDTTIVQGCLISSDLFHSACCLSVKMHNIFQGVHNIFQPVSHKTITVVPQKFSVIL